MVGEKRQLEFGLYANAIDSIEYAVDCLAYARDLEPEKRYKRAILAIAQGIELLLKERLYRVHPSLIWESVDRFPDISARTVGLEGAVTRLNKIGGVSIDNDDLSLVRSLKKTRNAIEHYKWSIAQQQAECLVGKTLCFAIFFARTHLEYDLMGYEKNKDGSIHDLLDSNEAFASEYDRRESLENHSDETLQCENCNSLIHCDESQSCPKCGKAAKGMALRDLIGDKVFDIPF